jgi:hypothetical protein
MNFINKLNALGVCKAIVMLENKPRGSWALVHVYDNEGNEEFFDQHQTNKSDSLLHLPAAGSHHGIQHVYELC